MSAQVDHDLLADYVGGALDGTPDADRVAELIASSPQWRNAAEELTSALRAVSDDLEVLRRTPEVMPPEIVARFDELLASPAMTPTATRPPVDPLASRRPARTAPPSRRMRRWAVPVAMLCVVFGFAAVANLFPSLSEQGEKTASAPQQDAAGLTESSQGSSVPVIVSGQQHNSTSLRSPTRMSSPGVPPGTYDSKSAAPPPSRGMGLFGVIPPELERLTDPIALRKCLDAVAAVLPGQATLVDYAYFDFKPALVISITSIGGKWTFVAGPNCGINGPDEKFRAPLP